MKGAVLFAVAVLVICSCSAEAALTCTPTKDPCLCIGKYFILDINHLFDYPVSGVPDGVYPEKYNYTYSPCRPLVCNTTEETTAAVCQYLLYRSENHNCGEVKEAEWTISEDGPLQFQIHYKGGDVAYGSARSSIVSFSSNGVLDHNTIKMLREEKTGENILYYFEVVIADRAKFAKAFKHLDHN